MSLRQLILWLLLAVSLMVLAANFAQMSTDGSVGGSDFRAYWAASRLFLERRNPIDPSNVLEVERIHFDPEQEAAVMAWNPPTLWVLMLPLACMPFSVARWVWFCVNLVLMVVSALMLSTFALPQGRVLPSLVFFLAVFTLPPVLSALFMGQITSLVVFGLVAAAWLIHGDRWFWAGTVLTLTSVKPHLVVLLVPYLMIYAATRRKWSLWLGLGVALIACLAVLFTLRPSWFSDYFQPLLMPQVGWETPTIGGLLIYLGAPPWLRFIGIGTFALLPLLLIGPRPVSLLTAASVILLVSIPTAVFGWSYDQSLLIIPLAQIVGWVFASPESKGARWMVGGAAVVVMALNILQRIANPNDVLLFWVPLAWGIIYALAMVQLGGEDWVSFRRSIGSAVNRAQNWLGIQPHGSGG